MAQWFVKDLSKLTGVTVQTLHHYDRIGLLKPSTRLDNGYRVYSEKDLVKLQQILALKFFGFELSKISVLISEQSSALLHFNNQIKVLEQKAAALLQGAETLRSILDKTGSEQSIPWENIIKLIEVYRMTADLEHGWVREIFTPDELKQYVAFETELKATTDKEVFEKEWQKLINEMKAHLTQDPNSEIGISLGKKTMAWVNAVYGKKYAHLRTKKFEQGFGEGKGLDEVGLTPEIVSWMDRAIDAYWHDRIYAILAQVGSVPTDMVLSHWNEMLTDLYGDDDNRKEAIYDLVSKDPKVSEEAKSWVRDLRDS